MLARNAAHPNLHFAALYADSLAAQDPRIIQFGLKVAF
jgi:hypothetical protein